ncbi:MAG: hypothetical protein U0792_09250 [Gemmataceae bacterium]
MIIEVGETAVHVRRQHLDAELAGIGVIDEHVAFVAVVDFGRQQRGHVLGRKCVFRYAVW